MAWNSVIKSEDPKALEMLSENLSLLSDRREYMQKVNDHYKAHGTMAGFEGMDAKTVNEFNARVNEHQPAPYPGRFFNENYASSRQIQNNIDRVKNKPETLFKGWQFKEGEAVINLANNRLQLMFNDKPTDEQRNTLKKNGFKWAPSAKAWQRPLDYKSMAAADKIDFIKPLNGRKPSDLQPAKPVKNEPER